MFRSHVPYYERRGLLLAGLLFFVVVDVVNVVAEEWASAALGVLIVGLCAWQLARLPASRDPG